MSAPIRIDGFEAVFRADPDPWGTYERRDEAVKRRAVAHACGRTRGRGLELGCGNGSNTRLLAARALRLHALDGAPSAVALTRARAGSPRVSIERALLPDGAPDTPFDLIVIAEVLYYLTPREIARLGRRLRLAPGGRLVLAHHHVDFADTSSRPARVHDLLTRAMRPGPAVFTRRTARWRVEAFDAPETEYGPETEQGPETGPNAIHPRLCPLIGPRSALKSLGLRN
ncbi:class I SAM-dependent methyltransferase [uncultured Algimonas sp.]|uniref:class I SAM-dependent methyltransferase n=1 Tax=uncultured Algimonas sp. TaxID=1547920 RepID=UPI002632E677|nr:class I SAM-dependent methyltransferase [uncultured Algimonas sp.]